MNERLDRRQLLEKLGRVTAGFLVQKIMLPYAVGVMSGISSRAVWDEWGPGADEEVRKAAERFDFAQMGGDRALELLGLRGRDTNLYAGPGHSLFPGQTHPADMYGLLTLGGYLGFAEAWREGRVHYETSLPAKLSGNLVFVGGSTSQVAPRVLLQYRGRDSDHLNRPEDAVLPLRFVGISDRDRVEERRQLLGDGQLVEGPVWGFEDRNGEPHFPSFDGYRRTSDLLLVTRLPNFLEDPSGKATQHSIVFLSGASGAGTRAIGVLMEDELLLRSIESQAGRYFQALIEVSVEYREGQIEPVRPLADPLVFSVSFPEETWPLAHRVAIQRLDELRHGYEAGLQA